jgi:hypothetical protein
LVIFGGGTAKNNQKYPYSFQNLPIFGRFLSGMHAILDPTQFVDKGE